MDEPRPTADLAALPEQTHSPEYNRGWADGSANALNACYPIISGLQSRLDAAPGRHPSRAALPDRVIVDQHGHYWRDYGDALSMCPVSDENTETLIAAVYRLSGHDPDLVARPADEEEGRLHDAASEIVRLGNQPGMDDDEWEAAMTELESALAGRARAGAAAVAGAGVAAPTLEFPERLR